MERGSRRGVRRSHRPIVVGVQALVKAGLRPPPSAATAFGGCGLDKRLDTDTVPPRDRRANAERTADTLPNVSHSKFKRGLEGKRGLSGRAIDERQGPTGGVTVAPRLRPLEIAAPVIGKPSALDAKNPAPRPSFGIRAVP